MCVCVCVCVCIYIYIYVCVFIFRYDTILFDNVELANIFAFVDSLSSPPAVDEDPENKEIHPAPAPSPPPLNDDAEQSDADTVDIE